MNLLSAMVGIALTLAADPAITRFARFRHADRVAYGLVEGDRVRVITGTPFGTWKKTDTTHALAEVELLVPAEPTKVLALALNYKSHSIEKPPPETPEVFFKAPSCLVPTGADIVFPPGATEVHYEAELVIVIGKRAKNVGPGEALDHVLGVTCGNDVSERVWQKKDIQWWRAKGSDTFGPCGPFIASGLDYGNLDMTLRQNGAVKLKTNTREMIHGVAATVSWASRHLTLHPGDLIFTGTAGITEKIEPGDEIEVEIAGVGVLKNRVAGAAPARARTGAAE